MIFKNYFISFIEEMVANPDYAGYVGGRVEVWADAGPHAIEEIRFLTTKASEFRAFRERWDFMNVSKWRLNRLRRKIAKDFNDIRLVIPR